MDRDRKTGGGALRRAPTATASSSWRTALRTTPRAASPPRSCPSGPSGRTRPGRSATWTRSPPTCRRLPPAWRPASADVPRRLQPPGPSGPRPRRTWSARWWYGMISVVLIVVWALSGRDYFWPVWPILGFMLFLGWQVFYVWYGPARFDDDSPRRDR